MNKKIIKLIKKYRAAAEKRWHPVHGYKNEFEHGQSNFADRFVADLEKLLDCSDCDFVEIWPSYDEQRCKHHKLTSGDRKIVGKGIPHWCPLKNAKAQQK